MTETEILAGILDREGRVYTDRPADRGGPTKFGITQATLSAWRRRSVSAAEVQLLTEDEACAIYRAQYLGQWAWIPEEALRVLLADWTITSGPEAPTRALQLAVGAAVDGQVGAETRAKTFGADPGLTYKAVLAARLRFYVRLALTDPPMRVLLSVNGTMQAHNLAGWVNRCLQFLEAA